MDNLIITNELNKLIRQAIKNDEVPVGALIVRNNVIISKAYNKRNKTNNPLQHAEILAIIKACKVLKNWRLNECELYVTMCPCKMCKSIIENSRIGKVYYFSNNFSNDLNGESKTKYEFIDNDNKFECYIANFFKKKRTNVCKNNVENDRKK